MQKHDRVEDWLWCGPNKSFLLSLTRQDIDWLLLVTKIGKPTTLGELTVIAAYIKFNTILFWFPLSLRMSPLKKIAYGTFMIFILSKKKAWVQGNVDI